MRAELDGVKSQISALIEIMAKMQQTMEASLALTARNEEKVSTHPPGYPTGPAPAPWAHMGQATQTHQGQQLSAYGLPPNYEPPTAAPEGYDYHASGDN